MCLRRARFHDAFAAHTPRITPLLIKSIKSISFVAEEKRNDQRQSDMGMGPINTRRGAEKPKR
jgi:hypothetical protein